MFTKGMVAYDGPRKPPEHNYIRRAKANPKSLKLAIWAACFHCMGGTEDHMPDPGWRELIRTCTSKVCPLHVHRPTKIARNRKGVPEYGQEQEREIELSGMHGVLGDSEEVLGGSTSEDDVVLSEVHEDREEV